MKKLLLFALLPLFCFQSNAQTTIAGKLVGYDGKPMAKADVYIEAIGKKDLFFSTEVEQNGSYIISTDYEGFVTIRFAGVHHRKYEFLLLLDKSVNEIINVKLRTYDLPDEYPGVRILGDFNNFSVSTAREMTKQPDGTFITTIESSKNTVQYQLLDVVHINLISGTQADAYYYNYDESSYRSSVNTKDGKASIIFDPKLLPVSDRREEVSFNDSLSIAAKTFNIYLAQKKRIDYYFRSLGTYQISKNHTAEFTFDASSQLQDISEQISEVKNPILKRLLLLYQLIIADKNRPQNFPILTNIALQVITEIKPNSLIWSIDQDVYSLGIIVKLSKEKLIPDNDRFRFQKYLEEYLVINPDPEAKSLLLYANLLSAKKEGDQQSVSEYYNKLLSKYPDTEYSKNAQLLLEHKTDVGSLIPPFSLNSISNPKETYTNTSFEGKIYLIDFWASWCGPCVVEMENLHNVFDKFKSKGFDILSISLDSDTKDVKKFRDKKWKMPWHHAFLDGGYQNPVAEAFGIVGIPKPILVDGNSGKILAVDDELRGDELEKTLNKFFH